MLHTWLPLLLSVPFVSSACTSLDHQACDELCKTDSFWYGHCNGWDGVDFSCKCYEYRAPLDGSACKPKQIECMSKCKSKGLDGGFCYPQSSRHGASPNTNCQCFQTLPDLVRRRRRRAVGSYKIIY